MTCVPIRQFQIATGNDNEAGLQVLIDILAPYAVWPRLRLGIQAYQNYDAGLVRITGDTGIFIAGFPSITWRLSALTFEQEEFIRNTYCSTLLSGPVTVRTNTNDLPETFSNFNAMLHVRKALELDARYQRYLSYEMQFLRMVALP